jgi:hypothetical protein
MLQELNYIIITDISRGRYFTESQYFGFKGKAY